MSDPREVHQVAADRVLAYLKNTVGQGLFFKRGEDIQLSVYTDADFGGKPVDRRSTTGYCTLLGPNLVTWRSKKQKEVSLSSVESEFRALVKGICEGLWIKELLVDLRLFMQPNIIIYCDNQSTIAIAQNPVQPDRTKHTARIRHFIKEKVEMQIVLPQFIPTTEQLADFLPRVSPIPNFSVSSPS